MGKAKRIWGTLDPFHEPGPILGRKVANTAFLNALLKADPFDEYRFFPSSGKLGNALAEYLEATVPDIYSPGRIKIIDRRKLPRQLAKVSFHCFHLSDCITSQTALARLRNQYAHTIFPVTGVIHSLSYADYGEPFLRHLWPGTTARDAVICTSSPGMETVARMFAWLRESYALDPATHPAPQLRRIPLAVDTEAYTPASGPRPSGPVRLLVFGRISHHSKMDLVPLVRALHRLIADGMPRDAVELVLAGWGRSDDDFLPSLKAYTENAGVALTVVLRPSEQKKIELFRSADIFVSIADNPQETFGITLAEAAAFGLPVVASEYDGYRDIVAQGETGLLVPTVGPDHTPDVDVLAPVLFGNQYHLLLAQRTAVEVPLLAEALKTLIGSPGLRKSMGTAARARAEERFSWHTVVNRYLALWEELWQQPAAPEPLRAAPHPLQMPYGTLFGHYTTRTLSPETVLVTGRTGEAFYRGKDFPTLYAGMRPIIDPQVAKKLAFLARKPVDSETLIRKLVATESHLDENAASTHLLWALKHDILERIA